jgi:hypothetical protein
MDKGQSLQYSRKCTELNKQLIENEGVKYHGVNRTVQGHLG